MSGKRVSLYWRFCWSVVTPVLMIIIFVYSAISIEPLTYGRMNYPGEYIGKTLSVVGRFRNDQNSILNLESIFFFQPLDGQYLHSVYFKYVARSNPFFFLFQNYILSLVSHMGYL